MGKDYEHAKEGQARLAYSPGVDPQSWVGRRIRIRWRSGTVTFIPFLARIIHEGAGNFTLTPGLGKADGEIVDLVQNARGSLELSNG